MYQNSVWTHLERLAIETLHSPLTLTLETMARPQSLSKRKNKPQICFSDAELATAEQNARDARMTFSEYGRFLMAGVRPRRLKATEAQEIQLKALSAIQEISGALDRLKSRLPDDILRELSAVVKSAGQKINKGL